MTVFEAVEQVRAEQAAQRIEMGKLNALLQAVLRAVAPGLVEASPELEAIAARAELLVTETHALAEKLLTLRAVPDHPFLTAAAAAKPTQALSAAQAAKRGAASAKGKSHVRNRSSRARKRRPQPD